MANALLSAVMGRAAKDLLAAPTQIEIARVAPMTLRSIVFCTRRKTLAALELPAEDGHLWLLIKKKSEIGWKLEIQIVRMRITVRVKKFFKETLYIFFLRAIYFADSW